MVIPDDLQLLQYGRMGRKQESARDACSFHGWPAAVQHGQLDLGMHTLLGRTHFGR